MALPTAQLGSLPSMGGPSYVPTVQVSKEPKLWERALIQLLAGTAQNVLGQGIENVMSRDAAPEFGEKAATGFDKLVRGPKVTRQEASQRRDIAAADKRQMRGITADANLAKFNSLQDQLRRTQGLDLEGMRMQNENMQLDARLADSGQDRSLRERLAADEMRAQQLMAQIQGMRAQKLKQTEIDADRPLRDAQADKVRAETQGLQNSNQLMQRMLAGQSTAQAGQVSPAVAEFARAQTAPPPPDPVMDRAMAMIAQAQAPRSVVDQQPVATSSDAALQFAGMTPQTPEELLQLILARLAPTQNAQ